MSKDEIEKNKITTMKIPLAYSFNVETPNQLVEIMTEEGKLLFI